MKDVIDILEWQDIAVYMRNARAAALDEFGADGVERRYREGFSFIHSTQDIPDSGLFEKFAERFFGDLVVSSPGWLSEYRPIEDGIMEHVLECGAARRVRGWLWMPEEVAARVACAAAVPGFRFDDGARRMLELFGLAGGRV